MGLDPLHQAALFFSQVTLEPGDLAPVVDVKVLGHGTQPGLAEHPLWIAEYGVAAPQLPAGWSRWHLWQYQGDATVPGVEKTADLSRANRDLDLSVLLVAR